MKSASEQYWFSAKVSRRESEIHGNGLFVIEPVLEGEILISAGGRVLPKTFLDHLNSQSISWLPVPGGEKVLVAEGVEHFNASNLNHSCEPNLKFQYPDWKARVDIDPGTELTTDYGLLGYGNESLLLRGCLCGSDICRGDIRSTQRMEGDV